ncbi:MAG TPA: hypothetical protein DCZ72_02535 [Armatimonadetes bacterium]|nr:hypothetical protein [Armatimonadota bacterium]
MSRRSTSWRLAPALLIVLLLSACGSSNLTPAPTGATTGPQRPAGPTAGRELGTAVFEVDVESGQVEVTPLEGDATNRAVFNGSAVTFEASKLTQQTGQTESLSLSVRMTNRFGAPIGRDYLRVLVGEIRVSGPLTASLQNEVTSDPLSMSGLRGLTFVPGGAYLVTRFSTNRLYLVENGQASVFAGQGSAGFEDGNAVTARFNRPNDVIYHAAQDAFYVTDTGNHLIRRVSRDGTVTTIAGTRAQGAADGPGDQATFSAPQFINVDLDGSLVVTTGDGAIRRVRLTAGDPTQAASYLVSTVATGLKSPMGIAVGPDRTVYVAERAANRVRAIFTNGENVVIAGTGSAGTTQGYGNVAQLSGPVGLGWARDSLIVANSTGHDIRHIFLREGDTPWLASNWFVDQIAGASTPGFRDGVGLNALFNTPWGLRARDDGTIIVSDVQNSAIRRLGVPPVIQPTTPSSSGPHIVSVINATGAYGGMSEALPYFDYALPAGGLAPGATTDALEWQFAAATSVGRFRFVVTVEAQPNGNISPEGGHQTGAPRLRVQTVIRNSSQGPTDALSERDGAGQTATINQDTRGLAVDPDGVVYLASPRTVRRYDPRTNTITTIAGNPLEAGRAEGDGPTARFSELSGIAAPRPGVVYVADWPNYVIYVLLNTTGDPTNASDWQVTQILGTGQWGNAGDQNPTGFGAPQDIASTSDRTIWIVDSNSHVLLAACSSEDIADPLRWTVVKVAGGQHAEDRDLTDNPPRFNLPRAIAIGPDRAAYVADTENHRIRRVTADGTTTIFSGRPATVGLAPGYVDGEASSARYTYPSGIASDPAGNLFVVTDDRIRRVSPTGTATTLFSTQMRTSNFVRGIAVAPGGDVWFADQTGLRRISRIIATGSP